MAGTSLSKSVSLRIVANAGTAKETLDDIAAKADDINGKKSSLTVGVRTGDTKSQLDEITAKAHALGITNVKFSVKADTANADRKLDETKEKADSLRRSAFNLAAGFTGLNAVMDATSEDAGKFAKIMAVVNLATGPFEPLVAGATVVTAGLGSGLAAAGVGAGVFGLALKGVITDVTNADSAGVKLKGTMGLIQKQVNHTETVYSRWIGSSASGIESVLAPALALLPKALSIATQFLGPVEAALQDIIINVRAALNSPFWTSTIGEWAATSGPMLQDVATAIGNIIHGLAGILTTFMPMSTSMGAGLDNLTEKFAKWGETLGSHSGFQSLMSMAKTEAPMAIQVLKNLAAVLLHVGDSMSGLDGIGNSKSFLQVLLPLSNILASISKNADLDRLVLYLMAATDAGKKLNNTFQSLKVGASTVKDMADGASKFSQGFKDADVAASEASGTWGTLGGKFSSIGNAIKSLALKMGILRTATVEGAEAQEGMDVALDANPIGIVVVAVAALVAAIVILTMKSKTFRDFWKDAWSDIKNWTSDTISFIHADWSAFINTFVAGGHTIESAWNSVMGFFKRIGQDAINFVVEMFWTLPNKASAALSSLEGRLFSIGYNAILGLWHGMSSMIGWVLGQVENFASKVSGAFAKILKMASPSKVFAEHGKNIALGLVQGMNAMHGTVTTAATNLGAAVTTGFNVQTPRASGLGRASGGNTFNITVTGVVGDAGATGRQIVQTINTYLRQTGQPQLTAA